MFEEIIREMRKLSQPRQISISVPLDDKGFFDRLCPSKHCAGSFKVFFDDWRDKVVDPKAFCPFCRHEAPADEWNTPEQQAHINSVAMAEMSRLVSGALRRGVSRTRPKRISSGPFGIEMSLSYTPGRIPAVVPATASDELRQDFTCEVCACRYASLGASFFCPACGHNSAISSFETTLDTVRKTVAALGPLRANLEQAVDPDTAHNAVRQLLEDQFPRLVGAFERLNQSLFEKLSNQSQFPRKGAIFQRVDDASALWKAAAGTGYEAFAAPSELARLKLHFQRRHVLSHCQGIVDQSYLDRSGDASYAVGQRLVVREADVLELVELLAKIGAGLKTIA